MSVDLDVDEWDQWDPSGPAGKSAVDDDAPTDVAPTLHFPTLPAFVEHFASWYRREVFQGHERVWCPQWWRHPEAVVRLEAMWRALEALRQEEATGISLWLRDHADVHMAQLMAPGGPFTRCTVGGHATDPLDPLPVDPAPDDWWTQADSGL